MNEQIGKFDLQQTNSQLLPHLQNHSLHLWCLELLTSFSNATVGTQELLASFPRLIWLGSELPGWPWVRRRKGRTAIDQYLVK